MRGGVWLAVAFAVMVGQTPAGATEADPDWQRQSLEWLETIEPEGAVRVINPLGNVYARFGGYEPSVEILASIQHDAARHRQPQVSIDPFEGGLRVTTHRVLPEGETGGAASGMKTLEERIDLVLFVPEGSALEIRTEFGDVEVKGLKGDLSVESIEGNLHFRSIQGRVNARTARGAISATLETDVTKDKQTLATETGEIEVHLWDDADMKVIIATSGMISTDFSIDIEHRRLEEPGKSGIATVGQGERELVLSSKRGPVRLLRLERVAGYERTEEFSPMGGE